MEEFSEKFAEDDLGQAVQDGVGFVIGFCAPSESFDFGEGDSFFSGWTQFRCLVDWAGGFGRESGSFTRVEPDKLAKRAKIEDEGLVRLVGLSRWSYFFGFAV